MLIAVAFLLLITVFLGIANLINVLQGDFPSNTVALIHGLLAFTALLLILLYCTVVSYSNIVLVSFSILSLAALGGVILLTFRLRHKQPPAMLLILHPVFAILGVILLTISILP